MRVVAGSARGKRLVSPRGERTRPTADRVRQSLMDILAPWTGGRVWLDLYAGSGAVGIEALSRGASRAVFVERDRSACQAIRQNLQATGLKERARLICQDAARAVDELAREGHRFDVIFADPPYRFAVNGEAPPWAGLAALLERGGIFALQHAARATLPPMRGLKSVRSAEYGETRITFYVHETEESPWP